MKKNMCKGCSYLCNRIQIVYYEEDNTTLIIPPLRIMKPFCSKYELHMESIGRVIREEGRNKCRWYCE